MPTLPNPKHEAFVQGLLKGLSEDAAYQAAGFKPNRGNASRLKANDSVKKRLEELQQKVTAKVVETVTVERKWVIEALIENAEIALGRRKTKNTRKMKDSEFAVEVEEYDRDAAAANAALKLLGQIPEVALFSEPTTQNDVTVNITNAPQSTGQDHLAELASRFRPRIIDGGKKAG